MSWERGAGFRIVGAVVRQFVPPSGKCAFLTLAVPGGGRGEVKHECRTFDLLLVEEIRGLGVGQTVQVIGVIDNERLTNKAKQPVNVDGRDAWVTKLTIKGLTVEGASIKPKPGEAPADDRPADDYFR